MRRVAARLEGNNSRTGQQSFCFQKGPEHDHISLNRHHQIRVLADGRTIGYWHHFRRECRCGMFPDATYGGEWTT